MEPKMQNKSDNPPQDIFQPIRLERVSEKVANQLKLAIGNGVFKIGDRLPSERELSEKMGVSRPSVREALQKLELIGMIETVHGGGSIVRNLTEQSFRTPMESVLETDPKKVIELTEVRACMEAWASRMAAERRTESELELIHNLLKEMESDFAHGQIRAELDFKFHAEIAAAAHNIIFSHLMHSIYSLISQSVRVYREQVFVATTEQQQILTHHRKIYEAIEASDPEAAEVAMNQHLQFVIGEYRRRFLAG
jgi:GntR family transcriptional repressor for pyruvate dehydrogenase complex